MKKPSSSRRRSAGTAFVPRTLLRAAIAGAIPAVAAMQSGCGQVIAPGDGATDTASDQNQPDYQVIALAVYAFDGEAGDGDATDTGPRDVPPPPEDQQIIALAVIGFDAEAGTDAGFSVADVGFRG